VHNENKENVINEILITQTIDTKVVTIFHYYLLTNL